jgi:hypothetical protein
VKVHVQVSLGPPVAGEFTERPENVAPTPAKLATVILVGCKADSTSFRLVFTLVATVTIKLA